MASGTITMHTDSVDYNNGGPYTRGRRWLKNVINWYVDDNQNISFSSGGSTNNYEDWYVCSSSAAGWYISLEPQVNYGSGWVSLDRVRHWVGQCGTANRVYTVPMSETLIGQLGSYHLDGECQLRILYYAEVAPQPDAEFPNAFPNANYSAEVQVPVHIDVSWSAGLSYDANGGKGAPASQTGTTSGDYVEFTVSMTVPTRQHSIFEGWGDTPSGPARYHGGDKIRLTKDNPNKTIYAIWRYTYRPGMVNSGGTWKSCDRDGATGPTGRCNIRQSNKWIEMRIDPANVGLNDPPCIYESKWRIMKLIGLEAGPTDVSWTCPHQWN